MAEEVLLAPGIRAWRLRADEWRFGGLSALAIDRGALVALTDSGVVVRFAPPTAPSQAVRFSLHDLPGGPGSPLRKWARDSESLMRDPGGRGWWVGFETVHSLWLFDRDFTRVIDQRRLTVDWPPNKGGEAMVAVPGGVALLPELGGRAAGIGRVPRIEAPAWIADAARLPDGRLAMLVRRPSVRGFVNDVRIAAGAGQKARIIRLPTGWLDNMEGMAAQPLPDGRTRLWIVADNNFRPWMRSLLMAVDLPASARS